MFVIGSLERGGSERQMVNLAAGLVERGHEAIIVALDRVGGLEAEAQQRQVEVVRLYQKPPLGALKAQRLLQLIHRWRPDVLHPYLPRDNARVTLLKPLLHEVALVWGVRASDVDLSKYSRSTRIAWPLVVRASRFADLIIANSWAGAAHHVAAGFPPTRMAVVPNGIDTTVFHPDPAAGQRLRRSTGLDAHDLVVGLLGRYDPMKGHDEFLPIFAALAAVVPKARALVVGAHTESQRRQFFTHALRLGVADRISMLASTGAPQDVLNAVDVLALPSASEGFPNVIAEAMACGKPFVAYDVGDVRRISSGLCHVVERGDRRAFVTALADTLFNAPQSEVLRTRVKTEFSTMALIDGTLDVLGGVLLSRARKQSLPEV